MKAAAYRHSTDCQPRAAAWLRGVGPPSSAFMFKEHSNDCLISIIAIVFSIGSSRALIACGSFTSGWSRPEMISRFRGTKKHLKLFCIWQTTEAPVPRSRPSKLQLFQIASGLVGL